MNFATELTDSLEKFKKECAHFIKEEINRPSPVTVVLNDGKIENVVLVRQYGPDFMFLLDSKNNIMSVKITKIEGIYSPEFAAKNTPDGQTVLDALNAIPEPLSTILKSVAVKVMERLIKESIGNAPQHPKEEEITEDMINKYFKR